MHIPGMGLDLEVRSRGDFPREMVLRAEKMVRTVLPHTASGRWRLDLISVYPPLQKTLQYHLVIAPLGDVPIQLRVAMRSSLVSDAVSGLLRIAPGMSRDQLIRDITPAIDNLNQNNWHGVLDAENAHPLLSQGEGIVSLPIPSISSQRGTIMNGSVSAENSIKIHFSDADGIPPATIRIARPMLERLLEDADASSGVYTLQVAGAYSRFDTISDNCVEVTLGNQSGAVLVRLRARYGPKGNFFGFLRLPSGVKREQFFQNLEIAARALNESKWKEVIDNIAPEPSGRSLASPPPLPERVSASVLKVPAPAPAPAPAPVSVPAAPSGATTLPAATTLSQPAVVPPASNLSELSAEVTRLVALLKSILQDPEVKNGVFLSQALIDYARPFFPDEHAPGWIMKLLAELENRQKWIRRVGKKQYQVEQGFVKEHYPSASIQPLPKAVRNSPRVGNATAASTSPKTEDKQKGINGEAHPAVPSRSNGNGTGGSTLESLTAHLRQVDELIAGERQKLEAAVIVAREKVKLIEQSLEAARGEVTVAEALLQGFNQSLQTMLSQSQLAVRE